MKEMKKWGFIGCGNMGGALLTAALSSVPGQSIWVSDRNRELVASYADANGVTPASNAEIAASCDIIVLGVKPQVLPAVAAELAPTLATRTSYLLVSMAAGISIDSLCAMLQTEKKPVLRIMPNLPVAVGDGTVLYTPGQDADEALCAYFLQSMQGAGTWVELPEQLIDAGSAVSGCGPAFVYAFLDAMADGGVSCGLPRATALTLAAATLRGSAAQYLQTKTHPGILKDAVCSPGGSTIAGVRRLESGAFRGDVTEAVIAAYEKTKELGKK